MPGELRKDISVSTRYHARLPGETSGCVEEINTVAVLDSGVMSKRRSDFEVVASIVGGALGLILAVVFLVLVLVFLYELAGWWGVALPALVIGGLYVLIRLGRKEK
jgi:uncharacterized membrane protein